MAISPILLNGSIQQTDNVLHNQTKQVEKGMVDQGNIQVQQEKKKNSGQDRLCIPMRRCLRRDVLTRRKREKTAISETGEKGAGHQRRR